MFDDVVTKIGCPYCGTRNEIVLGRVGFGRIAKAVGCSECKKYFVADMTITLSGESRKIEGEDI